MSLHHFHKRLLLSQYNFVTYTINYFLMDRLKIIDVDSKINFWNDNKFNIFSNISNINYVRFSFLMFIDYISRLYMFRTYHFKEHARRKGGWKKFMRVWFSIFKWDYVALYTVRLPTIFKGQFEEIDKIWFEKEFLYNKNSLDLIVWDVCRLTEVSHYVYNLYNKFSYNLYDIEWYFETVYILYYDLFLAYFLKLLKIKFSAFNISILNFLNDYALKIFYIIKYPIKYLMLNHKLRYKLLIYKYNNLFYRNWLSHKKVSNFFIYFWEYIHFYQNKDFKKWLRLLRNYKTWHILKIGHELLDEVILATDIYNKKILRRKAIIARHFRWWDPYPLQTTPCTIIGPWRRTRLKKLGRRLRRFNKKQDYLFSCNDIKGNK